MKAGRELDLLVVQKVMGYTLAPAEGYVPSAASYVRPQDVPPYSTDIAAAWSVVEAIKGRQGDEELWVAIALTDGITDSGQPDNPNCYARVFRAGAYENIVAGAYAETAPLAICLAALRAKGVEV